MRIELPYGKTYIPFEAPKDRIITTGLSSMRAKRDGADIVAEALANSIGSKSLAELVADKNTATIIISDHTRPVPSRDIIPSMLCELRRGNPILT